MIDISLLPNATHTNKESTMHLVLRLRGGGDGLPPLSSELEMGIAAGGLIDQAIVRDPGRHKWDGSQTKISNVQILNSLHFQHVTGSRPPEPPIDAATYAAYGYPFFSKLPKPFLPVFRPCENSLRERKVIDRRLF
jgi:hypothetical protein